jgi:hypothetical protein
MAEAKEHEIECNRCGKFLANENDLDPWHGYHLLYDKSRLVCDECHSSNVIKLPIREVTENLTIKVQLKGARAFGWRVKLGAAMMTLASAIMGIKFDVIWERDETADQVRSIVEEINKGYRGGG